MALYLTQMQVTTVCRFRAGNSFHLDDLDSDTARGQPSGARNWISAIRQTFGLKQPTITSHMLCSTSTFCRWLSD